MRSSNSAVEMFLGLIVTALLGILSNGSDPPPICDSQFSKPNSTSKSKFARKRFNFFASLYKLLYIRIEPRNGNSKS